MPETLFKFKSNDDTIRVLDLDLPCAREEAALRMEVDVGQVTFVEANEVLSFEDFREVYSLEMPSLESQDSVGLATDWLTAEQAGKYPPERVWTILDCDGVLWLASGFHFVNRVGYLVTTEEHGFAMTDYAIA